MITPNEAFKKYLAAYRTASAEQKRYVYKPAILYKDLHCCGMALLVNLYLTDSAESSIVKGAVCDIISTEILEKERQLGIYPHRNLFYFAGSTYERIFEFLEEIGFEKVNTFKNFAHDNAPLLMYGLLNK